MATSIHISERVLSIRWPSAYLWLRPLETMSSIPFYKWLSQWMLSEIVLKCEVSIHLKTWFARSAGLSHNYWWFVDDFNRPFFFVRYATALFSSPNCLHVTRLAAYLFLYPAVTTIFCCVHVSDCNAITLFVVFTNGYHHLHNSPLFEIAICI